LLGISAFYHDAAAALLEDGQVVAAAHEERFTRMKHDPSFPAHAVRFCLERAGATLDSLDAVVFYDKPLLKFERLLETYYAHAPRGVRQFVASMPIWLREKALLKRLLRRELAAIEPCDRAGLKLLFSEHHLSHAASAFFPSPFDEAAVVTLDGVGEWATGSICAGRGRDISILREQRFPHSLGLLYSAFTYYLGFKVNSGEYKLMGLAPYGDPASDFFSKAERLIRYNLVDVREDGSLWMNQDYFDYAAGLRMIREDRWEDLFGFPARRPDDPLKPEHCHMALAIQKVTEDVVLRTARTAKGLTGASNLCLAGGVALNCVANGEILRSGLFERIWIQPAAGDAGGALGAALAVYHGHFREERPPRSGGDAMQGAYLGPEFSDDEIVRVLRRRGARWTRLDDFDELCRTVARLLAEGRVVGWFQGRMEWGPRALGNRSILGDARKPEMQRRLNLKIKFREGFRPFAPSVLAERAGEYFDLDAPSPYMLLTAPVRDARRRPLPEGLSSLPWREQLYRERSDVPAVTHVDFSARLQTVHRDTNPRYWRLIEAFREETGCALVVNTSFNVRGEPIVCTPLDAYRCFMRTDMDHLVLGDLLLHKAEQPEQDRDELGPEFEPD